MVIHEVDVPQVGDDEILVKVEGCGICGTDVHEYKGDPFGFCPVQLGHEGTGEIVALGKNVTADFTGKPLAVGDKIVKANGTVRDGVLTYKTSTVAPMILTPGGGFTFGSFLLILLIVGLVAVGVLYVLHLVHMKRLRARQAARKAGRPIPKTIPFRVRIGRWIRSLKK
jgi:hypothetical protein